MSEMGFYSLSTGKFHKKDQKSRLKISLLVMVVVFMGIWLTTLIILWGLTFTEELHMIRTHHQKM